MRGIISRFAPAPTGFLHLGHVVNAIHVWKETRARSGRVLLRIEDHDRQRSRRVFEEAILEDLAWLGFKADEPAVRQSERRAIYEDALGRLRALGLVYACDCTRAEIAQTTAGLKACTTTTQSGQKVVQAFRPADDEPADPELRYPGTCRDRGLADGEVIALRPDGRPHRFQVTASRFGRRGVNDDEPLTLFLFDVLHLDGADLIDAPTVERIAALEQITVGLPTIPRVITDDPLVAQGFLEATLAAGHEGVMVKAASAPYEAGRRGAGWIKVKPVHTLDLVVLAVEWGSGRRRGKSSATSACGKLPR